MATDTPLIDGIRTIDDFRRINTDDLDKLASEIRSFLVEKVSCTGGHLASNLGVVELTIALHRVFDSPEDKLVFDVGHQTYVHKILTGRAAGFDTLRQKDGLSGFPKRAESEHDILETGHASTAISAALGMVRAKRMMKHPDLVVAIVGDGALGGGMSFEALNDAGESKEPLIIVINDNDMSIAKNVGAVNNHLNDIRTSESYQRFKRNLAQMLHKIPKVGPRLSNGVLKFKNKIKYLLLPGVMFEEMGFTYLGPIDGHNIKALSVALRQAKELERPVIVHAITQKGRGYEPAECNPEKFHGIGSFDAGTGKINGSAQKTNSAVFADALIECASIDESIVAISAAMPNGTGLDRFALKFPERMYDVGIAEEHAVTMAAGMAIEGMRPVVAIYSTFLQRAYDQVLHDVCLQNLPVIFALDRAGLIGEDGETHQGIYDISYLGNLPNITLLSPSSQQELAAMLRYAFTLDGPVAIRYNRGSLPQTSIGKNTDLSSWEVLRELRDVNIIVTGRFTSRALEAAQGLDVGIVDARMLKPMDAALIDALGNRAKQIITIEDGAKIGGMGSRIACALPGIPVRILGVMETPVAHASIAQQDEICGLTQQHIRAEIINALEDAAK